MTLSDCEFNSSFSKTLSYQESFDVYDEGSGRSDYSETTQTTDFKTSSIFKKFINDLRYDETYKGANPEYLVYKEDGTDLTKEEYLSTITDILNLQFPRNIEVEKKLSEVDLTKLRQNEAEFIQEKLTDAGFKSVVIPQVLYELFYVLFRLTELSKNIENEDNFKKFLESYDILTPNHKVQTQKNIFTELSEEDLNAQYSECLKPYNVDHNEAEFQNYMIKIISFYELDYKEPLLFCNVASTLNYLITDVISDLSKLNDRLFELPSHLDVDLNLLPRFIELLEKQPDTNTEEKIRKIFNEVLAMQFKADSSKRFLYRGADINLDTIDNSSTNTSYSRSFGLSLLAMGEKDIGATALNYMMNAKTYCYALELDLNKPSKFEELIWIPPIQRTFKFHDTGEFHPRTKVGALALNEDIKGFYNGNINVNPLFLKTTKTMGELEFKVVNFIKENSILFLDETDSEFNISRL